MQTGGIDVALFMILRLLYVYLHERFLDDFRYAGLWPGK